MLVKVIYVKMINVINFIVLLYKCENVERRLEPFGGWLEALEDYQKIFR